MKEEEMLEFSEICEKLDQHGKDFEEGKVDQKAIAETFEAFATHPIMKFIGNLPPEKFIEFGNILIKEANKDKASPSAFWEHKGARKEKLNPFEIIWGYFGETDSGSEAEY